MMYDSSLSEHNSATFLLKPEARFVPLVATFQKSKASWQEEYSFLQTKILRPKVKKLNIMKCSIELLTSHETKNRGHTHRFQVSIILKDLKSSLSAKDFISNSLCDFNKPFLCDDGLKVFSRLIQVKMVVLCIFHLWIFPILVRFNLKFLCDIITENHSFPTYLCNIIQSSPCSIIVNY